jgi:archaeosine synthase beta-subunit
MNAIIPPIYPDKNSQRDLWILERRPQRNKLDPWRPYKFFVEEEHSASGEVASIATILLTNSECPWRCLMCDLWKNTLAEAVPTGAIPRQIKYALKHLPQASQIKLYNSGSFFDPHAIPVEDHPHIAELVGQFDRVIIECHPALVGEDCFRFKERIEGTLEVAMGLETAHPQILKKLNKRMTLEQFAVTSERLRIHDIALRTFILVKPPFMEECEAVEWTCKSLDFAFACGATAVTLIPTRAGNGAIDSLAKLGDFAPPKLFFLEAALEYGLVQSRGRVFADLWDADRMDGCSNCFQNRVERLRWMNLHQEIATPLPCEVCGGTLAR